MPPGIYIRTEEIKRKISESCMGRIHTKKTKRKISKSLKGKYPSKETKVRCKVGIRKYFEEHPNAHKGKNNGMFGKHHSKESIEKSRKSNLGKHNFRHSKEAIKKMSDSKMGKKNSMYGVHITGSKHPNWQGGIGRLPYPFEFDNKLKELIRERDGYICQLCGKTQKENSRKLDIHHIDYVKENLNPINLISLCRNCNVKANTGREDWIKFFNQKLKLLKIC